ncbi:hypothetical protein HYH02_001233 [Chlamydomonas schloesseri]|uniref:Secondary thiamine-phosphate synthase enzyme n=1 Tax=Chlamydomonas schloesseri TaxID=2026947 RepID=A0A835WTZ9_9CHLO|nr:hypothetical protein HYH02_001233 [Chlamydomonas schloesseri]|eukprot:KAG2454198.1 hypothetical protein HYH02_001233 [Chlamydomonas schloesseri]
MLSSGQRHAASGSQTTAGARAKALHSLAAPKSARPFTSKASAAPARRPVAAGALPHEPPGTSTEVRISPSQAPAVSAATGHQLIFSYHQLEVPATPPGIALVDVTPQIRELVAQAGLVEGSVNVLSRHTTTAVTINENEARLMDDVRQFLSQLAPASAPYLHNDLHLRPAPENWPGGWAAWAGQEPRNAHSHLLSMVLGNTLALPVSGGRLALGTWQSVLLVELDGPRPRTVGVQLTGWAAGGAVGNAATAAPARD